MRLHGPQSRFELSLVGRADSEGWCEIRVMVDDPADHWLATSRCLLSQEVLELADWFEAAAAGPALRGRFKVSTTDNMINFELIGDESRQLRIYLEWELRPLKRRELPVDEFYRDYPATAKVLNRAAASLREELSRKPKQR
jgi:hypothetical protein